MERIIASAAQAGVAEWVCCPGTQNRIFIKALERCPSVHRWQATDERSAGFFALGRIQATARAVAVVAGDGVDAASLLPAVVEAYYERRPLIVVTLGTPQPGGDCGKYGCTDRENLFSDFAPGIRIELPRKNDQQEPDLVSLCAEEFPIHLHLLCAEDFAAPPGAIETIRVADPPPRQRFRGSLAELSQMLRFRATQDGLALVLGALDPDEQESALWLARTLKAPVLADATCGLREKLDSLLLCNGSDLLIDNPPRNVLRIGAVPSFPFWRALEEIPQTNVFSITRAGFSGLQRPSCVIEGEPEQIVKALDDVVRVGDPYDYFSASRKNSGLREELLLTYPESDAALVQAFAQHACLAEVILLGSPEALTLWNTATSLRHPALYVRSISQAGGMNGALSAFFGNAVDASFACALVDTSSLLRDATGIAFLSQLPPGKRIVGVINSGEAADSPSTDIQQLARLCCAEYYTIRNEADFEVIEESDEDSFALLEILPDSEQTHALRDAL